MAMESTLAQLINHIVELEVENMQLKEMLRNKENGNEGETNSDSSREE